MSHLTQCVVLEEGSQVEEKKVTIEVLHGSLALDNFELKGTGKKKLKNLIVKEGEKQVIAL